MIWILSFLCILQTFDTKPLICRCRTFTPEGPGWPGFPCGPVGPWKQRHTWLRRHRVKVIIGGYRPGLRFTAKGAGLVLYVRYSDVHSHITSCPLLVCVEGQVMVALFMCRCSVRHTASPVCLPACPSCDIWMWFSSSPHFSTGFWGPTKWRPLIPYTICAKRFIKTDYLLQGRPCGKTCRSGERRDKICFFWLKGR